MDLIPDAELRTTVSNRLRRWTVEGKTLRRTLVLPSFKAAIEFVNRVAEVSEQMNHHPDIEIRYDKVSLGLSSHDAGGITQRDLDLANRIDDVAETSCNSGRLKSA